MKYSTWILNIVLVKKKKKQIRVCLNFHDLNNVCLKDDFPLPLIELMVDAIIGHEALYFMDGSSRIIKFECLQEMKNSQPFALQKGFFTIKACILGWRISMLPTKELCKIFLMTCSKKCWILHQWSSCKIKENK